MAEETQLGWRGIKVKNEDGRTGVIRGEYIGFLHAGLTITVEGKDDAYVQLNTNSKDSGESGWSWWCENFSSGPTWLKLGDHW